MIFLGLVGLGAGCGPTPERVSYEPPPFTGKVHQIRFPESGPKEKPEDLAGSPHVPPLPTKGQVVVEGKIVAGDSDTVGTIVMINFRLQRADGKTGTAGSAFATTTREKGVVSYRGEVIAPRDPGEYTLEIIGPPGVTYFGHAKATVVEAKPTP